MTVKRSPPPEAEACLCRPYPSSQKGGTLICEQVTDLETHARWLSTGRYRPRHALDAERECIATGLRQRVMREGPLTTTWTDVARFRCASPDCGAAWQVLPMLLARHLWRAWRVVEKVTLVEPLDDDQEAPPSEVPARTRRRWRARLAASARQLVVAFGAAGTVALDALATALGLDATRRELVDEYVGRLRVRSGQRLAAVAEHVHRLVRGVRLM